MNGKLSKFYKCDLHLHSGTGRDRNYNNEDFIDYIRQSDLDVISITDHNIINKDVYESLKSTTDKYIILGIEMNVALDDRIIKHYNLKIDDNYFHALLWFDFKEIDEIHKELLKLLKRKEIIQEESDIHYSEVINKADGHIFLLNEIQDAFDNFRFYFIPHEDNSDRSLSQYLPNGHSANEEFKSQLFYYNSDFAIEGKNHKKVIEYLDKNHHFRITDVYFSDAKKLEEIGKIYTWINFTGDFNGLILPFSDSEKRIFKSTEITDNPQKNMNQYLEKIRFEINGKEHNLTFSPGLNGIIGARGSGKSLLASIIAKEFGKYDRFNIKNINYKMRGSNFSTSKPEIKYIYQGYLSSLYDKRNYTQIEYIENIKKDISDKKEQDIEEALSQLSSIFDSIVEEISDFVKKNLNKPDFLNILQYTSENNLIKKSSSIWNYRHSEIVSISKHINIIIKDFDQAIKDISEFPVFRELPELNKLKKDAQKLNNETSTKLKESKENYNNLLKIMGSEEFENKTKLRESLLKNLYKKVEGYNLEIDTRKTQLEKLYNESLTYLKALFDLRLSIKQKLNTVEETYGKIYKENTEDTVKLSSKEKIKLYTSLDETQPIKDLYDIVFKIDVIGEDFKDNLWKWAVYDYKEYYRKNIIRKAQERIEVLQQGFKKIYDSIRLVNNFDVKMTYNDKEMNKYSPGKQAEILLKIILEKELSRTEYTSKIIIIDQPEDNLDTDTIVDSLVSKIREIKLQNQVFVVSHSAPVIINGDSDLIIHCKSITKTLDSETNNSDINTTFMYSRGNINNNEMRDKIVKVLDGGEKYLKMRVNKYDFKFRRENNNEDYKI